MADRTVGPATAASDSVRGRPLLAGTLLIGANLFDVVAAYPNMNIDHFVVVTGTAMYQVDITGWVWLQVAVGVAATLAGLVLVAGRRAAVPLGIACAALAIATGTLIFPYAPIRVALVVALNAAAIRLLIRHRYRLPG